jgi:hypothetical protein
MLNDPVVVVLISNQINATLVELTQGDTFSPERGVVKDCQASVEELMPSPRPRAETVFDAVPATCHLNPAALLS